MLEHTLVLEDDNLSEYLAADRYDLEYGSTELDGAFYRSLAARSGGAVLDLATGTGRIALALAAEGHSVTGVDVVDAMVDRASAKAADLDDIDVTFLVDDVRTMNLHRKFDLVTLAGNSLQAFLSDADRAAALNAVWRHLKPGGLFAFAVRFPQVAELAARLDVAAPWFSYSDSLGRDVFVSGTQHYHPLAQVMHHVTHRVFADGTPVEEPTRIALRYSFPQELDAALRTARLEVVERFGDFDGSPLTEASPYLAYVCRRAESRGAKA
ncbi:MAG: class I SAM-dependent methyltransferase [Actinomycetes bacterium]